MGFPRAGAGGRFGLESGRDALADMTAPPTLPSREKAATRRLRQAKTDAMQYFHNAYRVADMERTRHFYEDVIGVPLIGCEVVEVDPIDNSPSDYIHAFFELADGSYLAFFQYDNDKYPYYQRKHSYMDHYGVTVRDDEAFWAIVERVKAENIPHFLVEHPNCLSAYITEPDGLLFEIARPASFCADAIEGDEDPHEVLATWLAKHGSKQKVVAWGEQE
jgi:catechol 2,3-dioxygenase-like lactoylglutathione lyase family enzyme